MTEYRTDLCLVCEGPVPPDLDVCITCQIVIAVDKEHNDRV